MRIMCNGFGPAVPGLDKGYSNFAECSILRQGANHDHLIKFWIKVTLQGNN